MKKTRKVLDVRKLPREDVDVNDNDTLAALASMVRLERVRRDWTQARLGREVGVEHSTISFVESGDRVPSALVLLRLAGILKLDLGGLARLAVARRQGRRRAA